MIERREKCKGNRYVGKVLENKKKPSSFIYTNIFNSTDRLKYNYIQRIDWKSRPRRLAALYSAIRPCPFNRRLGVPLAADRRLLRPRRNYRFGYVKHLSDLVPHVHIHIYDQLLLGETFLVFLIRGWVMIVYVIESM